jgi:hypothetical protein
VSLRRTLAPLSIPELGREDLLAIVVELQRDMKKLEGRIERNEKELAEARSLRANGGVPARKLTLEEAHRRGILPRSPRRIRTWLSNASLRAIYRPELFVARVGARLEVDIAGLEEWRRQMAGAGAPAWPKGWSPTDAERRPQ